MSQVIDFDLLEKKAKQGDIVSQYHLGLVYHHEGDYEEALQWCREAARQGHREARYHVGYSYLHGEGVTQDTDLAMCWFLKSASQGHIGSILQIAYMLDYGFGVAENKQEAMHWYLDAAKRGVAAAQGRLGDLYLSGEIGFRADEMLAFQWYLKSAQNSQNSALNAMKAALCYETGIGTPQNIEMALYWYGVSAGRGSREAGFYLKKLKKAIVRLHKASERAQTGDAQAQYQLGRMYEDGILVSENRALALAWYSRAAEQGHEEALFSMAMIDELKPDNPFHVLPMQWEPAFIRFKQSLWGIKRQFSAE